MEEGEEVDLDEEVGWVEVLEVDLVALDVVPTFQLSATNAINQKQEKEPSFVFVS